MNSIRSTVAWLALAAAGTALTGCAGDGPGVALPTGSAPVTAPSATPPSAPPSAPPAAPGDLPSSGSNPPGTNPDGPPTGYTDLEKGPGWVVGVITRGGTGPCYGLAAEDGKTYALHSTEGITLTKNAHVRVKVIASRLRISCGEGQQVLLQAVEPIG
jgi:hypothetical protein